MYSPEDFGVCPICMRSPHRSGCPNKKQEPVPVAKCELCEGVIFVGDECFRVDGNYYHRECFENEYLFEA